MIIVLCFMLLNWLFIWRNVSLLLLLHWGHCLRRSGWSSDCVLKEIGLNCSLGIRSPLETLFLKRSWVLIWLRERTQTWWASRSFRTSLSRLGNSIRWKWLFWVYLLILVMGSCRFLLIWIHMIVVTAVAVIISLRVCVAWRWESLRKGWLRKYNCVFVRAQWRRILSRWTHRRTIYVYGCANRRHRTLIYGTKRASRRRRR